MYRIYQGIGIYTLRNPYGDVRKELEVEGSDLKYLWNQIYDGNDVAFEKMSASEMLYARIEVHAEEALAFIDDDDNNEDDVEFARICVGLAEKFGWDTTLYRADFVNCTFCGGIDAYSPDEINEEEAYLAAFRDSGYRVEVMDENG